MKANVIAGIAGIALGAAATTLIAQKQIGDAVTSSLAKFGVPAQLLGGSGDVLGTLKNLDPVAADQLETAWIESALGGAVAAVLGYIIISNLMEH